MAETKSPRPAPVASVHSTYPRYDVHLRLLLIPADVRHLTALAAVPRGNKTPTPPEELQATSWRTGGEREAGTQPETYSELLWADLYLPYRASDQWESLFTSVPRF